MDKSQDQPKKCFCARCFLPIDADDRVDIDGQNFHRMCSTCCICRTIPTSLKMFYGHVFCSNCFKTHVMSRFKGDAPRVFTNNWWMQWAPGAPGASPQEDKDKKAEGICRTIPTSLKMFYGHVFCSNCFKAHVMSRFKGDAPRVFTNNWWMQWAPGAPGAPPQEDKDKKTEEPKPTPPPEDCGHCKRCICARCLQSVNDNNKVVIGGQSFHPQCAKCCFCHVVPKDTVKIYYGQVFCEECFHKHVMNRTNDSPAEFFKNCFEQWQSNAQFAETMREMMSGNSSAPFVFMMQPPFGRCGNAEWTQPTEARKSATPALSIGEDSLGTSLKHRTDASEGSESAAESKAAAEKIEKLTKYLHERSTNFPEKQKKWKSFEESMQCWVDLQDPAIEVGCPKCLWQCGTIYISSALLRDVSP